MWGIKEQEKGGVAEWRPGKHGGKRKRGKRRSCL